MRAWISRSSTDMRADTTARSAPAGTRATGARRCCIRRQTLLFLRGAAACGVAGGGCGRNQLERRQPGRGADPLHRRLGLARAVRGAGPDPTACDVCRACARARWRRMWGLLRFSCFLACAQLQLAGHGAGPADILQTSSNGPSSSAHAGLLVLLALAITSFQQAIQALGGKTLAAAPHGVCRRFAGGAAFLLDARWQNDFAEVAPYAAIIAALLGWRLWRRLKG